MNPIALLFSFEGRINRAKWWLGNLYVIVLFLTCESLEYLYTGKFVDHSSTAQFSWPSVVTITIEALLISWALTTLVVKRLRDRGQSPWFVTLYWLPTFEVILGTLLYYFFRSTESGSFIVQISTILIGTGQKFSVGIGIWFYFIPGFQKKSRSAKRRRPNPLTAATGSAD